MRGYMKLETLRLVRSPGYLMSSIAMPLVMYLIFTNIPAMTGDNRGDTVLYVMISMAAFGAIGAALMNGMSVVQDRGNGWLRQLRITPLSPGRVVVARGLTGMLIALPAIFAICVVGGLLNGVRMPVGHWIAVIALLWLGTAPFTLLGLGIGYLVSVQAAQPVTMLLNFGLSLLGGLWIPSTFFPAMVQNIGKYTPTYGYGDMVRRIAFASAPRLLDIAVLVFWFVAFAALAAFAYRRAGRSTA